MSELTLLVLRLVFLLVLWGFVFAVVYALRSDLFGVSTRKLKDSSPQETQPVPPTANFRVSASLTGDPATDIIATPTTPSAPSAPARRLVITSGPKTGEEFPLGTEPLTIGRSSDSGLVIRDEYTSTHHARLVLKADQWYIHDLDSTNGTLLNSSRVSSPTPVPLNTPITIGKTTFELRN
ncbi:FHA domain-containing protein [Lysinibacter sp. HNR]|uniref:FHA domain-containing protein FhaB/FipA n=1 Tax=Lysinibacter sp. HNR TaxID=3031408 RepID=UPI0024354476|nr:FHA domain-containing protein [Lysinibacter sp. HNR]WGD37365.1 FHA domain-containing protein [Lysinibacter sp. HNR]